jgi:hypothetical protein
MPKSPVNILSTRVLSKQFSNENGFDRQGTGITSVFDDHTLFWDHGQFCKTYKTHSSGLPELLFNSGYSQLQSFTTFLQPYYDNTVHWAFCIGIKKTRLLLNWIKAMQSLQMLMPELQLCRKMEM